jgi:hypothetical protein
MGETTSTSPLAYGVACPGKFIATGFKSFLNPHPQDPARAVQFICLEGNESGTYFRGMSRLVNGAAEITIPEEWRLVTEAEGITVQATPRAAAVLHVAVPTRDRIVENHAFRPEVRGVPFGTQYPKELRDVLVANGILNADYTPNEATAAQLEWKLKDPEQVPARERWWLTAEERERLDPLRRPLPVEER